MAPAKPAGSPRRGFTLVELVLVIVLLGILAGTAIPALGRISEIRTGGAMARSVAHLRYAQTMAMATHLRTWLEYDVSGDSYQAYIEDPDNPGKSNRLPLTDPLTRGPLAIQFDDGFLSGVDLQAVAIGAGTEIEFDSLGIPHDSAGSAITASGTLTFDHGTITIAPETGYATGS